MELYDQQHISPSLQRLLAEDALGQLHTQTGRMAALGSENGVPKLDWVEGIARLLQQPTHLETVEAEARAIWKKGIRHVIWAGMGGSIITVRVLVELGFGGEHGGQDEQFITLHPLDSTDPAALNGLVRILAQHKNLPLSTETSPDGAFLRTLLTDVMMIGVSMGITSEEPITHLTWFTALLQQAQLPPAQPLLIMTLPTSYLDTFAKQYAVPTLPLQLDGGTGTGGRMSAPTTRVFLLPAALYLTRLSSATGQLHSVLQQAWQQHNRTATSPFVGLATALSDASTNGACRLLLTMPHEWQPLLQWIEQLMEESLGKGGQGIVVFATQPLASLAPNFRTAGTLAVQATAQGVPPETHFQLVQSYLADREPLARLAALVTSFLGWQLCMALYGYLHNITFAGQPAVENYKTRARLLRAQPNPLQVLENWPVQIADSLLALFAARIAQAPNRPSTPARLFADTIISLNNRAISYFDCTFNGVASPELHALLETQIHTIGNTLLGVPIKLRQAPAAYHSTEQSEMDGPPAVISLRILLHTHQHSILGAYDDKFLQAQAISTWQAMLEQGRHCSLLLVYGDDSAAIYALAKFFDEVKHVLIKEGETIA